MLLIFLLNSFNFFCSGNHEENEYDNRVNNITDFLKNEKNINIDSCKQVYLLQANKCNSCNEENINYIFNEISQQKNENPKIFVLNGFNEEIVKLLLQKQGQVDFRIVIDDKGSLDKKGLSFMKNLFISICDRKVVKWKFY